MKYHHRQISLGFCPDRFSEGLHICYLYSNEEERRQVMRDFLAAGLKDNDQILYLVDMVTPEVFVEKLREDGLDVGNEARQFNLQPALPALCPTGSFNPENALNLAGDFYTQALEHGFSGARGVGEMSWAQQDDAIAWIDILKFEARLNDTLKQTPMTACCQYDLRHFSGTEIVDILSVHPQMIVRGQLVQNPYYVDPEVFMGELKARKDTIL